MLRPGRHGSTFLTVTFFSSLNSVQQLLTFFAPALPWAAHQICRRERGVVPSLGDIPQSWARRHTEVTFQSEVANAFVT